MSFIAHDLSHNYLDDTNYTSCKNIHLDHSKSVKFNINAKKP